MSKISSASCPESSTGPAAKKEVNYDDETLWREFSPSQKDLIFNLVLAPTLIWIPFSVAAVGRCAFVKYRITDKRIIVKTDAPWQSALLRPAPDRYMHALSQSTGPCKELVD